MVKEKEVKINFKDITKIEMLVNNEWKIMEISDGIFKTNSPTIDDLLKALQKAHYSKYDYIWITFCNLISKQYKKAEKEISEIDIHRLEIGGYFDFYLRKEINIEYPIEYVVLYEMGEPMMSITPMEIQSHINPYLWSHGNVLIVGLGLGFITNQILQKESVKSVDVIELEPTVIELYSKQFPEQLKNPKLHIIQSDIFGYTSKKHYHYVYMDIWSRFSFDRMLNDTNRLLDRKQHGYIDFENISFWTVEDAIWHDLFETSNHFKEICEKYHVSFGENEIHNLFSILRGI